MIQAVNKDCMHYVNCIYIDSEINYFMNLIMYKSPKQHITQVYNEVHWKYVFHKQIHI